MRRILELIKPDLSRRSEMFYKVTYLLVILVCLALVVPSLSCAEGQSPVNKRLELQLDKAPRLNETVELSCLRTVSIRNASDNISYEKITLEIERIDPKTRRVVEVPPQDVLVGGSLNWEAAVKIDKPNNRIEVSPQNVLAEDSLNLETAASRGVPLKFSATIKFPYEGNWRICASSTYRPSDSDCVFLNVAEDSGAFGSKKDYAPPVYPYPQTLSEQEPITVELDILKPPRLDEPFQITWGISTIRDISEASGEVRFYLMEGTERTSVPVEEVLIKGDVAWKGSLKKDSPLRFSATVKLPKEGDWSVLATCDSYVEREPINAGYVLYLHVGKDKGEWGWTEPHEKPLQGPPPLPNQ
jgi:hypothetical protein